ncbi:MAG: hypothetical protein VYB30_03520 [Candidatus Thermoplasmatota archaeon]|nr:hypothetical protein [Candidatus Thermoplasmatota archaeon]
MEEPDNLPADNICAIPTKVFILGLCPDCGADVKIEWKQCNSCFFDLG